MKTTVHKTELEKIRPFRTQYLQEANHQVRYNACHERGWSDSYLVTVDNLNVGYGSIKGREIPDRDTVFEFFLIPPFRRCASDLFREFLSVARPRFIECQSNDLFLSGMLFEFARNISADTVLFEDHCVTNLFVPGALFRPRRDSDAVFPHTVEPAGEYVIEVNSEIVATGGFMLHYNHPFADLHMEVREDCRGRGIAGFLLQEVKRECYLAGRVPAARTGIRNLGSRGALIKAGLRVCGYMLSSEVNL